MIASLAPSAARTVGRWLAHLGGLGFIPLGILDSSIVPVPGSMDFLLVFLAAHDPHLWLYYAAMATIGSVIGGVLTYRLASKGGKEALERRVEPARLKKVYAAFERGGPWAIAVPAFLPPPMPLVPFLLA